MTGSAIQAEVDQATAPPLNWRDRFLDRVERLGNALPDPVMIFVIIIVVLVLLSVIGAAAGWNAVNPVTGEVLAAKSLLSEALVRQLLMEMPKTYTGFAPFGLALTLILGAGIADQSGLLGTAMRGAMRRVPGALLVPAVVLIGMLSTHAVDAGYLVYIPLAGVISPPLVATRCWGSFWALSVAALASRAICCRGNMMC